MAPNHTPKKCKWERGSHFHSPKITKATTATPGNILNSPFPILLFSYGGITKYTTTTMTLTMEVPNYLEEASDPKSNTSLP